MKRGIELCILPLAECQTAIPALARWHHREWAWLNPGDTVERRARRLRGQCLGRNPLPATWVALAEGRPLGSASLVAQDMDTRPGFTPWLATVFVEPVHRGRGIGGALVRRVGEEAGRFGYRDLYLFTPDRAAWYGGFGWEELETVSYRGSPVVVMKKSLPGPQSKEAPDSLK